MNKIKVSVIGVGHLGNFHARIFSEMEDVEFVGVYDADEVRAKEIADKYNTNVFTNIDDAMNKADAVSIVTPTRFHYEIAEKCLSLGKDIFIEKPITSTTAEAEKLLVKQRQIKNIFQVGHVERFNAVILTVGDMIKNPKFIEVDRLGPYSFRSTDIGVVRDLMIHDIDIVLHLVKSKIKDIHAVGFPIISDMPDIANARIIFENGCVANINASRASLKQMRKIRVFQADSYLSIDYMKQKAALYEKKDLKGKPPKTLLDYIKKRSIRIKKNRPLDEELKAFIHSVKTRQEPVVTCEHGKNALEVGQKIIEQINN